MGIQRLNTINTPFELLMGMIAPDRNICGKTIRLTARLAAFLLERKRNVNAEYEGPLLMFLPIVCFDRYIISVLSDIPAENSGCQIVLTICF